MAVEAASYANIEALVSTEWVAEHGSDPGIRLVEVDVDTAAYDTAHVAWLASPGPRPAWFAPFQLQRNPTWWSHHCALDWLARWMPRLNEFTKRSQPNRVSA